MTESVDVSWRLPSACHTSRVIPAHCVDGQPVMEREEEDILSEYISFDGVYGWEGCLPFIITKTQMSEEPLVNILIGYQTHWLPYSLVTILLGCHTLWLLYSLATILPSYHTHWLPYSLVTILPDYHPVTCVLTRSYSFGTWTIMTSLLWSVDVDNVTLLYLARWMLRIVLLPDLTFTSNLSSSTCTRTLVHSPHPVHSSAVDS